MTMPMQEGNEMATWQAWETAVSAAVDLIKAAPFEPGVDNENDPSGTHLYLAASELVAIAVERGCDPDMICAFLKLDLNSLSGGA